MSSERSPKRQRISYSPESPPPLQTKAYTQITPPPSVHMSPSWQSQNLSTTTNTPPQIARSTEGGESPVEKPTEREDVEMEEEDHRRTDHERIGDIPLLYCLSTEPVDLLQPEPSNDMLDLYSLKLLQASVARRDPKTGEKINKLRKSYETKSRNLGIEGRNKASVQEGHLQGLVDPLWDSMVNEQSTMWEQRMEETSIGGKSTEEMFISLDKALTWKSGRLPKAEHLEWTQQLGLDEAARPDGLPALLVPKTDPIAARRATAPSSPTGLRPDRAGKKRRYNESSYEGYDDDGYSTGGVDDTGRRINAAKRARRKM